MAVTASFACGLGPLRRPAARTVRPGEQCAGKDGQECAFSTTSLGAPARVHSDRAQRGCLFCSEERLHEVLAQQSGEQVTRTLLAARALSLDKYEENLRLRRGDAFAADFRASVLRATKRREQKATPKCAEIAEGFAARCFAESASAGALARPTSVRS